MFQLQQLEWNLFSEIDRFRRLYGEIFDLWGVGPVTSRPRSLFRDRLFTLKAYGTVEAGKPIVVMIPAPIKRSYIWDLLRSMFYRKR